LDEELKMRDENHPEDVSRRGVSTKTMEIVVAGMILLLGLVVISDSWRVGARWAEDGPQAGYFPFYVGVILCTASAWIMVRAAFFKKAAAGIFVYRKKLRLVTSVFVPSAIFVVAIYFIGIYVASALYIGAFMYWHGRFPWKKIIPVSAFVPVFIFLMFEVWFLVPLPKGPLETLIGY
jgi:hypothetical protein